MTGKLQPQTFLTGTWDRQQKRPLKALDAKGRQLKFKDREKQNPDEEPGNDPNTRVVIIVLNLELYLGETPAAVTVNLTDANNGVHTVSAEDVRPIPGGLGFTQVTFRLPNNLLAGTCQVRLLAHDLTSNVGAIRIIQ